MQNSAQEITKLCESWWGRLTDSSRIEQRSYVMKLLALLDWDLPIPFSPRPAAERLSALPYLLRGDGQTTIAAYFLMPGALEAPSTITDKGLDYCPTTRALFLETQSPNINYVLISDLYRSYFYDARAGDLLLQADDPAMFNREITDCLKRGRVARGALEEIRREPRSAVARRLREWRERWQNALKEYTQVSNEALEALMDRLTVARFLFKHDILRRTRKRLEKRFLALVDQATNDTPAARRDCSAKLARLFHDMWLDWGTDIFAPLPELDTLLEDNDLIAPLLKEFMLLSPAKFAIPTILESFNHGDPTEKMRVRMVPDENEDREYYLGRQSPDTIDEARIEIDVHDEGYRAVLHWFDRLMSVYERMNRDFECRVQQETPPRTDLDLFIWGEVDAKRPSACADRLGHACTRGFGIYYSTSRQFRLSRLLLTLHLITLYTRIQQASDRLPVLSEVFMKRPGVAAVKRPHVIPGGTRIVVES